MLKRLNITGNFDIGRQSKLTHFGHLYPNFGHMKP
jgi:hypothetical protein